MLGDGCVFDRSENCCQFIFVQSQVHSRYFLFVLNIFANRVTALSNYTTKYVCVDCQFMKVHRMSFEVPTSIRQMWYPDKIKIVPAEICLDPISIAHWLMDDGTLWETRNEDTDERAELDVPENTPSALPDNSPLPAYSEEMPFCSSVDMCYFTHFTFCSQGFSEDCNNRLASKLNDLGIEAKVKLL
jgi:hypothetical protein